MSRLHKFVGVSAGLFIATVLIGCDQPSVADGQTKAAAEKSQSPAQRVTAGPPERKTLRRETVQPAWIEAFEQAPLHAKLTGYVDQVHVDIGDRVEQGQELITLAVPELEDDVQQREALLVQAQAEVQQAESAVRAAEAGVTTAESLVAQAKAGLGRAQGERERWKAEFNRINELAARGSISDKLVDETRNQLRSAESAYQEAEAGIAAAEAGLGQSRANREKAKADLVAAQARVRVAQANLDRAKTMFGYTRIKAPFTGVVTRRHVDPGHFVQPASGTNAMPLLVLIQADTVRVFVDVPELEVALVDVGDKAVIHIQSLSSEEIQGQVTRTSWDLDPANRSLRTEIDIPNKTGLLRPGMYATVTLLLEEKEDVLTLPVSAIVREGRQTFCCVVENGRIRRVPITLGLRSGDQIEIAAGLSGSETVVLARADSLQEGQAVEILKP